MKKYYVFLDYPVSGVQCKEVEIELKDDQTSLDAAGMIRLANPYTVKVVSVSSFLATVLQCRDEFGNILFDEERSGVDKYDLLRRLFVYLTDIDKASNERVWSDQWPVDTVAIPTYNHKLPPVLTLEMANWSESDREYTVQQMQNEASMFVNEWYKSF